MAEAAKKLDTQQKGEAKALTKAAQQKITRGKIVRKEIQDRRKNIERDYLDLAALISEAFHKEYYLDWGFKNFGEFAEQEMETKYRKAMYFVEIHDRMKGLGIPAKELKKLGWTKAKEVVAIATEETKDEWLAKAGKMSAKELQEAVSITRRKDAGAGPDPRPSLTTLKLTMSESEGQTILDAIEEAKKAASTENAVAALEMICTEWMLERGSEAEPLKLSALVEYAQRVYGVSLVQKDGKKAKETKAKGTKASKDKEAKEAKPEAEKTSEPAPTGEGEVIDVGEPSPEGADAGPAEEDIDAILGIS